jgi:hypothetical protein
MGKRMRHNVATRASHKPPNLLKKLSLRLPAGIATRELFIV